MLQPSPLSKSNENLNQNKLNYQKYNPPPPSNYSKPSSSYYNQSADNQWDRNQRYPKKDQPPPYSKSYRSDEPDYDYQQSAPKNRYQLMDDRTPPPPPHQSSSYSRQTPYYTSKPHHQSSSQQSSSYNYRPSRGSQPAGESAGSYESEYERKRRLAFEAAPWNEGSNNGSPRTSPVDRHSQSSGGGGGSKMYKHHPASSSTSYTSPSASTFKKTADNAEHYLDPWRRSKSPFSGGSGSRSVGLSHGGHAQPTYHHSKSKSDSGSNFSNSESELIDSHKAKRLDPYYANKQRPSSSSYRESGNGELAPSYAPYENPTRHTAVDHHAPHQSASSTNKKLPPYYNKPAGHHQPPEPPLNDRVDNPPVASSYHHSAASASSYPKSTTPTNEMDIPNYERPKNPTRTRKDSWSDSDSCSTSSDSSYSATGSDSESNSDEPYSRYFDDDDRTLIVTGRILFYWWSINRVFSLSLPPLLTERTNSSPPGR